MFSVAPDFLPSPLISSPSPDPLSSPFEERVTQQCPWWGSYTVLPRTTPTSPYP